MLFKLKKALKEFIGESGTFASLVKNVDGHIRVVKVFTSKNQTLTRSIVHLYPVELKDRNQPTFTEENLNEQPVEDEQSCRPTGMSTHKAQQKIKKWTSQLFIN